MILSMSTRRLASFCLTFSLLWAATASSGGYEPALAAESKQIEKIKVVVKDEKVGNEIYTVGSAVFPVERSRLWAILVDYKNASKTFANLSKSEVLERKDNTIKLHQIVKPGYFPFTFDYVVDLTETPETLIEWRRLSGSFAAYNGSWGLEDWPKKTASTEAESAAAADASKAVNTPPATRLTYRVFLDANKFIPQWLMRRSLHGYLPEVFDSLRKELNRQRP